MDVRVSARYKPPRDPNYHELKQVERGDITIHTCTESCSASPVPGLALTQLPASQQDDARVHGPRDGGCEPEDAGELATMATTAGDAVAECVAVMDFGELVSAM